MCAGSPYPPPLAFLEILTHSPFFLDLASVPPELPGLLLSSLLRNWEPSQPDNWEGHGMGGGEDCAHFLPSGKWNDNVCQKPFRWICEADLS